MPRPCPDPVSTHPPLALPQFLDDDGQSIEPDHYVPVIPMVLVNGADGIGTGWSTFIPNYNPRDIIANLRRMLNEVGTAHLLYLSGV